MSLKLSLPEHLEMKPNIAIFGVGGAGGNAVNNMIASGLEGVDFWVANTDAQALEHSLTQSRIQLGTGSTKGLGAGSHPEVGKHSAEESIGDIKSILENVNMVFITAGMGGGTGTGAAPVIAKIAKDLGILTVGVVTKPFHFEGARRMKVAELGVEELNKYVDTLIVIPNQNLFRIANENTTFAEAFKLADNVLHSGVRGITDLITMPGLINLDFADIRTVMSEMGKAMMGTGEGDGENRAVAAAEAAISNPLLDHTSMKGARGVLINITGGTDMTLFQVDAAANRIREEVDPNANIIFGSAFNPNLEGKIRVSVVATGIDYKAPVHQTIAAKPEILKPLMQASPTISLSTFSFALETNESGDLETNENVGAEEHTFIPPKHVDFSNHEANQDLNTNNAFLTSIEDHLTEKQTVNTANENTTLDLIDESFNNLKDQEENKADEPAKKSREDFFDIPAFLRKKMGL